MINDEKDMVDKENETEMTSETGEATRETATDAMTSESSEQETTDNTSNDNPTGYRKTVAKKSKKPAQKKQKETIKEKSEETKEMKKEAEEAKEESCSSCTSTGSDCGKYLSYVLIGLGFLLLYNIAMLWNTGDILETKIDAMEAAAIPLDMTMTIITAADCEDCSNIHDIVAQVGKLNINITEQKELAGDSEEAQALIEGYQIKTLHAVLLGFDPAMALKAKP